MRYHPIITALCSRKNSALGFLPMPQKVTDALHKIHIRGTIVRTMQEAAHTGRRGDGKIFISTIDAAISIRTGDRGDDAI